MDKIEQLGTETKSGTILLMNQGLMHHETVMHAQQGVHQEVSKGIEQQENCCIELNSGLDSLKKQIFFEGKKI